MLTKLAAVWSSCPAGTAFLARPQKRFAAGPTPARRSSGGSTNELPFLAAIVMVIWR
jgi:hypothetical protein